MFAVGQVVVTRSSGLSSKVIEVVDIETVKTDMGDHGRQYKVKNLCTVEEYRKIWEAREARRKKKFGRR